MRKAFVLLVREHVKHMPRLYTCLVVLPKSGVEQICVVLHEDTTHRVIAQQERPEGFREHVFWSD